VTANGYGKRTELAEYRVQSRGGKGIITIKTTERNGPVVAAISMLDTEEVMLITNKGMLIRMPAKGISVIGRNTQGVRLITVESREEQVAGVARVAETTPEAEAVEGRDPDDGEPGVDGEGPADGGRGGGAPDGEDGGP
jgi:DNA gyrase subunit A